MRLAGAEIQVALYQRFERAFTAVHTYRNAAQDVALKVDFISPAGLHHEAAGFWDGGQIWKVRFSPDEVGAWTFRTTSSAADDTGLNNQSGGFACIRYSGTNPLYRHGPLRLSPNRRYLVYADGTPFFWLGDTAWNGPLKAGLADWTRYLDDRRAKSFTGIQFVTTQWIAAAGNADARAAFENFDRISIDPVFFQWLDARVDLINERGMIAAPVLLWDTGPAGLSPGVTLADDQLIVLARYLVARYGAHQVIWILNGDGDYRGNRAERWKNIGRAVFGAHPDRLVTCHPAGLQWIADEFRSQSWFGFNSYQSSHGGNDTTYRWITEGPPARDWKRSPILPSINLEPNYEAHRSFPSGVPFDAHAVRRAAYWSLLAAPPAGISYGAHGIWSWESTPELPMNHPDTGIARPWFEAMHLPGSTDMLYLKQLFDSLEWWNLRPAPELLAVQPGHTVAANFISSARSEDGSWALLYAPTGGAIQWNLSSMSAAKYAGFYNPRDGHWSHPQSIDPRSDTLALPDANDWVVWLGETPPGAALSAP